MLKLKVKPEHWRIIRFLMIFIVSVYIFYQLPPPKINSEKLTQTQYLNDTYLEIPESIIAKNAYPQNFEELIWRILFAYSKPGKVCFENGGTFLQFPDGTISDVVNVTISYNNMQPVQVKSVYCVPLKESQDKFTFKWKFDTRFDVAEMIRHTIPQVVLYNKTERITKVASVVMHPDTKAYIVPEGSLGQVLTFIVVFLFTGSLFWLWKGGIDFIKKGWLGK